MFYNGDTKPDANFYSDNGKYDPIGWIDLYSDTDARFGTKSTTKNTGLNYFASYYIGPNNPKYNNNDNFDLIPQDEVDAAALEHDKCYDKAGCKGVHGALVNLNCKHCDDNLSVSCLSIVIDNYNPELLNDANKFAQTVSSLGLTTETVKLAIKKLQDGNEFLFDVVKSERDRALLTGLLFADITTIKNIRVAINNTVTDYGKREIEKNDLLHENDKKQISPEPKQLSKTIEELKAENKDLEEKRIALLKEANQWEFMEKVYNNKVLPVNEVLDAKRLNQAKQNFLKSNAELGISETETNKIINTCIIRMDEESFKRYAATQKTEMAELVGTLTEQDKFENGEAGFELGNLVKNASFEIDLANNKHKLRKLADDLQEKIKNNDDLINKNTPQLHSPQ